MNKARIKRIYQFIVGRPLKVSSDYFDPEIPRLTPFIDYETYYNKENPANGLMLDSHQVDFKINKSSTSTTNTANINFANLPDPFVKDLDINQGTDQVCAFYAGWLLSDGTKELKRIFIGTVTKVTDTWQGTTKTTRITLTDGGTNAKNAKTSRFYPAGTPFDSIVQDLVKDMGVPNGALIKLDGQPITRRPVSYTDFTDNILSDLGRKHKYWWSIQDGQGYFVPNDSRLSETAAFISPNTGLKGRIQIWDDATTNSKTSTLPEQNGIEFSCQLDGAIIPEYTVVVDDREFQGAYKVKEVQIQGNLEGSLWDCKVKAVIVDKLVHK